MPEKQAVELLAPAGDFSSLHAALSAGADAVYFGAGDLNMRAGGARNFTVEELPEVVRLCHEKGAKAYLALNTIIYDPELPNLYALCKKAKKAGVDACIAGDMAVITYLRELGVSVHLTVQCNVSNLPAVRYYARFADAIVLARELSLESVSAIAEGIRSEDIRGPSGALLKLEIFAHGALCVAISGQCGMSLCSYNSSSNRGRCLQNCRRKYLVRDAETGVELRIENQYIMSPRDLCTVEVLDRILDSGVSILKIEGRGRPADYTRTVTQVYSEAIQAWRTGTFNSGRTATWCERLKKVFNRGFWTGGYYLGMETGKWSGAPGSQTPEQKLYLGKIASFQPQKSMAEMKIETRTLVRPGGKLLIVGPETGAVESNPEELNSGSGETMDHAERSDIIFFRVPETVHPADKVYLMVPRKKQKEE